MKRSFAQNGYEGIVVDLMFRVGILEGFITLFCENDDGYHCPRRIRDSKDGILDEVPRRIRSFQEH